MCHPDEKPSFMQFYYWYRKNRDVVGDEAIREYLYGDLTYLHDPMLLLNMDKAVRILKGKMKIEDGRIVMHPARGQGNVMISSSIGCDVLAIVPAGSGKLEAGTQLEGFLV